MQVLFSDAPSAIAVHVVQQVGSADRSNLHIGPLPVLALDGLDI
jgi:hypothetical protein